MYQGYSSGNNDSENLSRESGDGGAQKVTEERLAAFKDEIAGINNDASSGVNLRRETAENARFCYWAGQSPDGRKRREFLHREAFPFEGASDARVRLIDRVVNELVLLGQAALSRMGCRVIGSDANDHGFGANMHKILKHQVTHAMRGEWRREWELLQQYQYGGSPGAAVMMVSWKRDMCIKSVEVTIDQLGEYLQALYEYYGDQATEQDVRAVQEMVLDEEQHDDAVVFIQQILPSLKKSRASKIVSSLRKTGVATFPQPYVRQNRPAVRALEVYNDVFFPAQTGGDLQRARCIFVREWLSETEVEEQATLFGWNRKFVDDVLTHEGESGFQEYIQRDTHENSGYSYTITSTEQLAQRHKGQYEIITGYYRAVTDDGVPGIFQLTFHHAVDRPAGDRELLPYDHCRYPFVPFYTEAVHHRLIEARGVPEVLITHQELIKVVQDSFSDHSQLSTLPPIKVPQDRGDIAVNLRPAGLLKELRPGEINFMDMPDYPRSALDHIALIEKQADDYYGRPNAALDDTMQQFKRQATVDRLLEGAREVYIMILQLCQQYMTDADLQRITGKEDFVLPRSVDEIQGQFDLEVSFDVRDLDFNFLVKLGEIVQRFIMPLDTSNTIRRDVLVQRLFSAIDPSLSDSVVQPEQIADQKEIMDELNRFALIKAGIEPPMAAEGENFQLRLQALEILEQQQQAIAAQGVDGGPLSDFDEYSLRLFNNRKEHLQFQVQQMQNAQTGRVGAEPVLDQIQ